MRKDESTPVWLSVFSLNFEYETNENLRTQIVIHKRSDGELKKKTFVKKIETQLFFPTFFFFVQHKRKLNRLIHHIFSNERTTSILKNIRMHGHLTESRIFSG